jgi:uncharacterized membrane protein
MSATSGGRTAQLGRLTIPVTLVLVVILGSTLRLHGISNQSLWNDELASWNGSNFTRVQDVIAHGVRPDVHPPGYYLLLYLVIRTFGDSESALRIPSAIAGILTILAIYALGAYIYSPKEGLLAAALMAASLTPIYHSQEARPYSFLLLLSILTSHAWLRMAREMRTVQRLRWASVALYIPVATLTCYVHYFGLFLVLLQGAYSALAFVRDRSSLVRAGIAYGIIGILYLPWLPALGGDLLRTETWIPRPTLSSLQGYTGYLFSNSLVLSLVALVLIGVVAWRQIKKSRDPALASLNERLLDPTFVLLFWLAVPVSAAFVKSLISTPVFTNRNLIISLPAAYLLLARSFFVLPWSRKIGPTLASAAAVLLSIGLVTHMSFNLDYYTGVHREQFREAVQYVVDSSPAYPGNLVFGCAWSTRYFEYYFDHFGSTRTVLGPVRTREHEAYVRQILRETPADHIWYISGHREPTHEFLEFLSSELVEIESHEFYGARVWLYRVPQGPAAPHE